MKSLIEEPKDMEEFIRMIEDKGFKIKRGKHLTLKYPGFKKSIRMDSLGDGYIGRDIRANHCLHVAAFVQRDTGIFLHPEKNSLLIDIEAKLSEVVYRAVMSVGRRFITCSRWATINYLREHGLFDHC